MFASAKKYLVYVPNAVLDCPVFEFDTPEAAHKSVEEWRNLGCDVFLYEKLSEHAAIYDTGT